MNYIYSALLLHSAKKEITEENIRKVVSSIETPDESKIKALVAALEGVNIEEVINKAAMPVSVAAPATASVTTEKKEEKPSEEEQEKKAEEAAAGLSALFG